MTEPGATAAAATGWGADLVVIGPEAPLVAGAADEVRAAGIACFGPSARAARIEASKAFAKDVMRAAGVPTAPSELVADAAELDAALPSSGPPWVVKDDGLASGKGVLVTAGARAARAHAHFVLATGRPVLLESYLDGPEVSLFCLVDGETVVPLVPAQDFKRLADGDTGPNTGGMGAYAPLEWLPENFTSDAVEHIVAPAAAELARRGSPYSGLLYAGLVLTAQGPAVLEFNCRFGDPETQSVLGLLRSPLGELLHATATGRLAAAPAPEFAPGAAVTVVLAAAGYPDETRTGDVITGADQPGVLHAGTARRADGALVSAGGRVLSVVGTGSTVAAAREHAYCRLGSVHLDGSQHRGDIAVEAEPGGEAKRANTVADHRAAPGPATESRDHAR
jgi:phosphoribosylamine--glycine ligase